MLVLELELLEEMLFSLFIMFFAAAVSLVLNKLANYVSRKTTAPKMAIMESYLTN
ncbi:MAG: hypothetical protein ACFFED_06210 [Candidatus Thorarchaeota archaeon]